MTTDVWHKLEGFDLDATTFPLRVQLDGQLVLVFQTPSGYRGVERSCPHLKASLADAILMANGTVLRCSLHNFTFKLSDGRGVNGPSYRLKVFDIKIEDGTAYGRPAN